MTKDLMVIPYTEYVGGVYPMEMIVMFNITRVSEEDIRELLKNGMIDSSNMCVVMTKMQYENLQTKEN